jgi:hypothetical protein
MKKPNTGEANIMFDKTKSFLNGWNAALDELDDYLDEIQADLKKQRKQHLIIEIRNIVKGMHDYHGALKVEKND